jgi:hypothetical protein
LYPEELVRLSFNESMASWICRQCTRFQYPKRRPIVDDIRDAPIIGYAAIREGYSADLVAIRRFPEGFFSAHSRIRAA